MATPVTRTVFPPAHWQALAARLASPEDFRRDKRAERLWSAGCDDLRSGRYVSAQQNFHRALLRQPDIADGYLGLYAAGQCGTEVLQGLALTADSLKSLQRRFQKQISVLYRPFLLQVASVQNADDARLFYIRRLLDEGDVAAAQYWLTRCLDEDPRVRLVRARALFLEGRIRDALLICEEIAKSDQEFGGDAVLGVVAALMRLGENEAAERRIRLELAAKPDREHALYLRYQLGLMLLCDKKRMAEGRRILERIERESPNFLDVRKRLAASLTLDERWERITAQLLDEGYMALCEGS